MASDKRKNPSWAFIKKTAMEWFGHQPFQLSSSLSYYTLFSLAPLLIIVIAIAGFAFGRETAENSILQTIQGMIGSQSAQAIQQMIRNASNKPHAGMISTAVGVIALLFGAGGVVGQLQTSLNTVWGIEPRPGRGIWTFVRQRFISFAMVLAIGFLLLVSLAITALLSAFAQWMGGLVGAAAVVAHIIDFLVSFVFVTVLFAIIYKFLPDARIEWRDVWIGAAITSVLFTIGKTLIGLYLGKSGTSSAYGAAGSLITVLLWVYYSSLILFLGAEFTHVYAADYGSGVRPAENAQPVSAAPGREPPEAQAEQGKKNLRPSHAHDSRAAFRYRD